MDRSLITHKLRSGASIESNGFTILEVMVALAILTISLTGIYRLHGQTMLVSSSARFYSLAPMLAQSKLSEVEHLEYEALTNASGDFIDTYPGYNWSIQFEDIPTELITEKYYHLTRIVVEISYNEEDSYQLRTYRFFVDE